MKNMKKFISLVIILTITCGCMAMTAFASPPSFTDVPSDAYYAKAVAWAVQSGITAGVGDNKFGPSNPCTRGQIMTMLWRAAGSPGHQTAESVFTDVRQGDYFYDAVLWAVENGVTAGVGNNKFGPNNPCTRAQIVTFLWKARGSQTPANTTNQFTDVASDAYYAKAVAWAVENEVTSGVGNNRFGSNETCTRAQIVTFLWKADQINDVQPDKPIEPPHQHYYAAHKVNPTCTEQGYIVYKCACGDSYKSDYVNATGHDYQNIVVAPTCTEKGYTEHTCSKCGHSYTDSYVDVIPHTIIIERVEPSYTTNGYEKEVCSVCHKVISEKVLEANGAHKFSTQNLAEVAKKFVDEGDLDYARYLNHTDWTIDVCDICKFPDHNTIKFAHTPEEATKIMLGYVNNLRAEVYGSHKYDLKMDKTLNDLAQIRAKEISKNYSHIGGTYTNASENITAVGPNIINQYNSFLNSPDHKTIMLGKDSKYFGYGFYGTERFFGVQLFWSDLQRDWYNIETQPY